MYLELKRGHKEDYLRVGEIKVGIVTRWLTRLSSPLRVVMPPRGLKKRITLTFKDAQEQWTGLAEGKDKPFTKEITAFGVTTHTGCPVRNCDQITL